MRAAVAGSTGFIGRAVCAAVHARGWHVSSIDRDDHAENLTNTVHGLASNVDVVINCAGRTHGTGSELHDANVGLAQTLARAVANSPAQPRFVHIGSAAEYGTGCWPSPCTEDSPTNPVTSYGASKLAGTRTVLHTLPEAIVIRPTTVVGPGSRGFVATVCDQIAAAPRGPVTVGPLNAARDFIDVQDVAAAVVAIAGQHAIAPATSTPGIVNIGSGHATPLGAVLDLVRAVTGYEGHVRSRSSSTSPSSPVTGQWSAITKATTTYGWSPTLTLTESINTMWKTAKTVVAAT